LTRGSEIDRQRPDRQRPAPHRIVIVGGGFGGLRAAQSLKRLPVDVTVVDRRNFHLFQPLLYQVATGGLSPADIASPLRGILKRQANARVLLGRVVDIDLDARRVVLEDGGAVEYDVLVVAAGVRHHYFGNDGWERLAPGLKTIEDATAMRQRILFAFERAEREEDPARRRAWLTFVVAGGGPTGVELAGALREIASDTLRHDFRAMDPASAEVHLVELADRVLPTFPPDLSARAAKSLEELGVTLRLGTRVAGIEEGVVTLEEKGRALRLPARTALWAAGVRGSPLGKVLAERAGAELDPSGRVVVEPDLTLRGHPDVFVIGDLARFAHPGGEPLPGLAPVAMQEGAYVAEAIARRLRGSGPAPPFRYRDRGSLATIGRSRAVARLGKLHLSGFIAWLTWAFVHLFQLIELENRVLVFTQWAWSYFTRNRSARLITRADSTYLDEGPAQATKESQAPRRPSRYNVPGGATGSEKGTEAP
jgi:NADH dehydrogenase